MAQLVDGIQEDLPLSIAEPKDRIVLAIDAGNPRYRGGHDHLHTFRAGSSTPIGYLEWVCSEREKKRDRCRLSIRRRPRVWVPPYHAGIPDHE